MKKLLAMIASLALVLTLAACGNTDDEEDNQYELALITDVGTIDDKSFNQGAWEGMEAYAKDNDLTYKYYKPTDDSTQGRLDMIDLAIDGGASIVVCPGFLFEEAIFAAQDKYPDVKFILLDGTPHNADYSEYRCEDNVASIMYAEQEAGFMAGYAIVKAGYTKLGFNGGMAVPAVIRYGFGYVQGVEAAAKELGNTDDVEVMYYYCGGFDPTPDIQSMASGWYTNGTEVIFSAAGGAGASIMKAAEIANKYMIGVDVDQSSQSTSCITSAMKQLSVSVYDTLEQSYAGNFPGGKTTTYDLAMDGVGLPMENSSLNGFDQAAYDALIADILAGKYQINDTTEGSPADLVDSIKVTVVEG